MAWVLSILSLVVGVILDRVLGPLVEGPVHRFKSHLRRKLRRGASIDGEVFSVNNLEHVYVYEFSPHGYSAEQLHCNKRNAAEFKDLVLSDPFLRLSGEDVLSEVDLERRRLAKKPEPGDKPEWNGAFLALRDVTFRRSGLDEIPHLWMTFEESDYAARKAISSRWRMTQTGPHPLELRTDELRRVRAGLSHDFGVNATIETSDGDILLTRRSPDTRTLSLPTSHIRERRDDTKGYER